MILRITRPTNLPTTTDRIKNVEAHIGAALPSAYREFLLSSNGGRAERRIFPIEGLAMNPFGAVHFFFGIDAELDVYDLEKTFTFFRGRIPDDVLAIACNEGADYICIDLRRGGQRVVFWDHAHFWGTGEWRESDLYAIAGSVAEFLRLLRPDRR